MWIGADAGVAGIAIAVLGVLAGAFIIVVGLRRRKQVVGSTEDQLPEFDTRERAFERAEANIMTGGLLVGSLSMIGLNNSGYTHYAPISLLVTGVAFVLLGLCMRHKEVGTGWGWPWSFTEKMTRNRRAFVLFGLLFVGCGVALLTTGVGAW